MGGGVKSELININKIYRKILILNRRSREQKWSSRLSISFMHIPCDETIISIFFVLYSWTHVKRLLPQNKI